MLVYLKIHFFSITCNINTTGGHLMTEILDIFMSVLHYYHLCTYIRSYFNMLQGFTYTSTFNFSVASKSLISPI